jgi:hypothetical protein
MVHARASKQRDYIALRISPTQFENLPDDRQGSISVRLIYVKGGGERATHNWVTSCESLDSLSRLIVRTYSDLGLYWSPVNASLVETGRAAPMYLYLDADYVLVSLDSFCTQPPSSMIVPSINLTPTQHLVQPPEALRLVSLRDVQRSQTVARVVEAIARTPRHLRGTDPGQQLSKSSKKRSIELSEDKDGESTSIKKVRRESEVAVKRKGGPAKSKKK